MTTFRETSHLSEILEESEKQPVIVFKYSNQCGSSQRLYNKLKDVDTKNLIYLVTVQKQKNLSASIEELYGIKHESPQILIMKNRKILYSANHGKIKVEDFIEKYDK